MGKFIDRILRNPISFEIIAICAYSFYSLVYATVLMPSVLLVRWGIRFLGKSIFELFIFVLICCLSVCVFFLSAALIIGCLERLLTLGIKPGAYPVGSVVFFRWLTYSGLHLWTVILVLQFIRCSNWIKIYLRLAGAKIGKEVFINAKDLYDPYLLEIRDNVIIGGDAFVNCHLFENGYLYLGKIILGEGVSVGAHAYVTPGTNAGKNSKIGIHTCSATPI
jgi:hypothetical protein